MRWVWIAVLIAALAVNLIAGFLYGLSKPMQSDGKLFLQIAQSVADGDGYKLREGFWPDEPTMSRAPGWTLLAAAMLRIKYGAGSMVGKISDDTAMRLLCLACNAVSSYLLGLLTIKLFRTNVAGYLAAVAYSVYPPALYFAVTGASEILFVMLLLGGILLMLERRFVILGSLLLGLAAMVRVNIVLVPAALLVLVVIKQSWRRQLWLNKRIVAVALVVFSVPALVWTARNFNVSGKFPVLSTLRGQTLYGGNNQLVAGMNRSWGYWIFPDSIPGETSMRELATDMSELEADAYYTHKAIDFIRSELARMPLLWLGKLVRAYIPIPWQFSVGLLFMKGCRLLLYILVAFGLRAMWRETHRVYKAMILGFVMVNVLTVMVFWGCSRFSFLIEPLIFPYAAVAVYRLSLRQKEAKA